MYRNLPGSIYLLTGTKFLMMGSNFVYQFLALFLTKKVGVSEETTGLFFVASTGRRSSRSPRC
jgi:predicted MFS family arabinose efflux permease